jgi:biopolymer transport protein ExbD
MNKRFSRHKRSEAVDVDITSLLDILTILLVFLLKSYNASDLKIDLVKNLQIADSDARSLTTFAPVIQVDKSGLVFLNSKEIGRIPASGEMKSLTDSLKAHKARNKEEAGRTGKKINMDLVNLIFDKDIDYEAVQKIMNDSAVAGYSQFKFIVRGNY